MATTLDLSQVPGVVEITNNGEKKKSIGISGYSQSFPIMPEQTIKVKVFTTSEILGYLSQEAADPELSVKAPGEE